MNQKPGGARFLMGGVAAILALAWCLGPVGLIALGVSGGWIGNLAGLDPYCPIFIGVALGALFFAWRGIYRQAAAWKPGEVWGNSQVGGNYKVNFWIGAGVVLVGVGIS